LASAAWASSSRRNLPTMLSNQEVVGRFAREARAAVKIKSEHVARVSDVGTLENGAPYMVMEFLEGVDLAAWLQRQGPLPVEQAVDFVLQACVGVASAHGVGIVHRDLKPANLFCLRGNDGQFIIKVLDSTSSAESPEPDVAQEARIAHKEPKKTPPLGVSAHLTTPQTSTATPQPPSPPRPQSKAKPDCDPNYFFDNQGEKHFKPECFK
jgi:serine/threonine protein kinase